MKLVLVKEPALVKNNQSAHFYLPEGEGFSRSDRYLGVVNKFDDLSGFYLTGHVGSVSFPCTVAVNRKDVLRYFRAIAELRKNFCERPF